mmetsp:Transcript_39119/g.76314  ORF Transcript_39119/g.76314 Transcript_39119/m.76314 type:complete len:268 (-) Transcript_39119:718-1521(-)
MSIICIFCICCCIIAFCCAIARICASAIFCIAAEGGADMERRGSKSGAAAGAAEEDPRGSRDARSPRFGATEGIVQGSDAAPPFIKSNPEDGGFGSSAGLESPIKEKEDVEEATRSGTLLLLTSVETAGDFIERLPKMSSTGAGAAVGVGLETLSTGGDETVSLVWRPPNSEFSAAGSAAGAGAASVVDAGLATTAVSSPKSRRLTGGAGGGGAAAFFLEADFGAGATPPEALPFGFIPNKVRTLMAGSLTAALAWSPSGAISPAHV